MWTCPNCNRIFQKAKQPHTCRKVLLEEHFKNKDLAKSIFDALITQIKDKVGKIEIISIPCCIHLYGTYDFLAVLPKKDKLEIRFALDRVIKSPRLKQSVSLSKKYYKNCVDVKSIEEIDRELITWIHESFHLKDK